MPSTNVMPPVLKMRDGRRRLECLLVTEDDRPVRLEVVCGDQKIDAVSLRDRELSWSTVVDLLRTKLASYGWRPEGDSDG